MEEGAGCVGVVLFVCAWVVSALAGLAITVALAAIALDVLNIIDVVDFV